MTKNEFQTVKSHPIPSMTPRAIAYRKRMREDESYRLTLRQRKRKYYQKVKRYIEEQIKSILEEEEILKKEREEEEILKKEREEEEERSTPLVCPAGPPEAIGNTPSAGNTQCGTQCPFKVWNCNICQS